METHSSIFKSMSAADKWICFGNLASVAGFAAISIGTLLRLIAAGTLPSGRPVVTSNIGDLSEPARTTNQAKAYFS